MSRLVRIVFVFVLAVALAVPSVVLAQEERPASPHGKAATQVGGEWVSQENGRTSYEGGQWMEISYGRPILRGRDGIFGSGETYGDRVTAGAPVWRAGANQTTRLVTDAPIVIGGTRIEPGEYSLFVDLSEEEWTLIVSDQPYQQEYDPENEGATWGAYGYDPEHDVARAPMDVATLDHSIDQFTISFQDVTGEGGEIAMMWDETMATVPFRLAGGMEEAAGAE